MGLDHRGRQIVQCGIELLELKEELFHLYAGAQTNADALRAARLEQRKVELLEEVDLISGSAR